MKISISINPITKNPDAIVRSGSGLHLYGVKISDADRAAIETADNVAEAAASVEYPDGATGHEIAAIDDALDAAIDNLKQIAAIAARNAEKV